MVFLKALLKFLSIVHDTELVVAMFNQHFKVETSIEDIVRLGKKDSIKQWVFLLRQWRSQSYTLVPNWET